MIFNLFIEIKKYFSSQEPVKKESFGIYNPKCGMSYSNWKKERANKLKVQEVSLRSKKINVDYRKAVKYSDKTNDERYFSDKPLVSAGDFNSKKDYWARENRKSLEWETKYKSNRESEQKKVEDSIKEKRKNIFQEGLEMCQRAYELKRESERFWKSANKPRKFIDLFMNPLYY